MAHPKHEAVRQRYAFRRGYCGVHEADAGGELTVDHFLPSSSGGTAEDENLVYACVRCNLYKGALLSDGPDLGLLHPQRDDLSKHLCEDLESGRLEPLSERGRLEIAALRLNRPALVMNRQRRHLLALLQARLDQALAENATLRDRIARRDLYIRLLEERLEGGE